MADDYDSPWKDAIERYFADFLHFFFPKAHAQIDWHQPLHFLDKELSKVVRDAALGKRYVDKLVRVTLLGGAQEWVYVHLEIQGQPQAKFAERMFVYHYRLYERYRTPIASLAVLADERSNWRPEAFAYEVLGCRLGLHYPVAKLLDWAGSEARLQDSRNPFAVVTLAHLATQATRGDTAARYGAKRAIVQSLYRRDLDRQQVVDLFKLVDSMMSLPKDEEQQLRQSIADLEEETGMRYISSIERLAIEEGVQQGMQQGVQQGRLEGMSEVLARQLARRFGEVPDAIRSRLDAACDDELASWADAILSAPSMEAVFDQARS